jgi:hypothetical protein
MRIYSTTEGHFKQASNNASQASQQVAPWIKVLARLGYAARGIVYLVVGWLAIQVAIGSGGGTNSKTGALTEIAQQPFGQIMLGIVAFGLFAYTLWRLVQGIKDPENKGTDAKGIITRISYIVSGLTYAGLGIAAVQIIVNSLASSGGGSSKEDWTAKLLTQPFGQWLVGVFALIIFGVAAYQFYQSYSGKFMKMFKPGELSLTVKTWIERIGRIGYGARGIVYVIISGFLIQAAISHDASEAGGLAQALSTLAQQPYGPWLLGLVAAGLFGFGVYSLVEAGYRRIKV